MSNSRISALSGILKFFGLFPSENVKNHSVLDTLYVIGFNIPLLFIIVPAILHCYMNRRTQDVVSLTNFIYTISVFIALDLIYLYLGVRKFELRDIICELNAMVEKRNKFRASAFNWFKKKISFAGRKENQLSTSCYDSADWWSNFMIRGFSTCCWIATFGVILLPLAKPLVDHFQGIYLFESWYTPYPA